MIISFTTAKFITKLVFPFLKWLIGGRGDIPDERKKKKKKEPVVETTVSTAGPSAVARREGSTTSARVRRDSILGGKVKSYFNRQYNLEGLFPLLQTPDGIYGKLSQISYRDPERLGDLPVLKVSIYGVDAGSINKEAAKKLPESIEYNGKEISLEYIVLQR